jgi:uncharacterized protein YndB with AHSA1/START domain
MIDTDAIPAAGTNIRSLAKEVTVAASPMEAWAAWASSEGIDAWWGPPDTNIELAVGGPFELLFSDEAPPGSRGSEGCQYLAYVPGEMISFTWNAPPHLPLRSEHTWVVITFAAADGGTAVRLVHTGFLDGSDWDDYLAYFDDAWGRVLDRLAAHWG